MNQSDDLAVSWRNCMLLNPVMGDVAGVFASNKQANKSSAKGKYPSGSRLPVPAQSLASRSRSMSPRKGQPGLRERSINTPRASWNDQQSESSTSVQQSLSLGQNLTSAQPERQKRDDAMKQKCLERDNNRCIITKRDHPGNQCAHIVPHKLNGSSTRGVTWAWLESFWGKARTDRWKAELLGDSNHQVNTEQVKNLITLGSQEHNYWDNCLCSFRHLKTYEQNTKMDIAFHWLPLRGSEKRTDSIPTMSHPFPNQPQGYDKSPGGNRYLLHCGTLNLISSGYIFTVTTTNPVTHPLPSEELLKMQWNLSRIASMQGAGEDEDSDIDSDDDFVDDFVAITSGSRSPTP